jgi:ABC-type antimicrobial peptide transport system permease subunit
MPDIPVTFTTLEDDASESMAAPRFRTLLFGIFAGLAVSLAMAGIYGVMAYAVRRRASEIGIRMALGASSGSALRLMPQQGLVLASIGLALGLTAAVGVARLLTSMMFQVKPNDPSIYWESAILVGTVALAACYLPARRAAAVDPAETLRAE